MKVARFVLGALLLIGTVLATAATVAGIGVEAAEEPRGISLREESARYGGLGFL